MLGTSLHRLSSPGADDDDDATIRARLCVLTAVTMLPVV
jgi:hypothetical protein